MFWKRKIQLVCSHCGAKIQVDSKHFQQLEQRKKDDPSNPPSFEVAKLSSFNADSRLTHSYSSRER